MTIDKMLVNVRAAAEWLRQRASGNPPAPPTHVLIEWSAALKHLADTWTDPGTEAQIAVEVGNIARRQLAAMRLPRQHVKGKCGKCGKRIPVPSIEQATAALAGSAEPAWLMGHLMMWTDGSPDEGDCIEAVRVRCQDCGGKGFCGVQT